MPHHAHPAIAGIAARSAGLVAAARFLPASGLADSLRGAEGFFDRCLHGMELVVARHLLGEPAVVVLEDDEIPEQVEESSLVKDAVEQHLELRHLHVRQRKAGHGAPRFEPLAARGKRAEPGLGAVRDHQQLVVAKQRRQLGFVGLELMERREDGGVLVGRVLELDQPQGETVYEQHDVRPPFVLVLGDGELVDGEPVVPFRILEVNDGRLAARDGPVGSAILDRHAINQVFMERAVPGFEVGSFYPRELAERVLAGLRGERGVEARESAAELLLQDDLAVVVALGSEFARSDVGAQDDLPAEAAEPCQGGVFDDGFGERPH